MNQALPSPVTASDSDAIVAPILTIAVFLLLFVVATYIPLPRGIGIFKDISVLIY